MMSNTNDLSNRTLTIERTFNAPIQLVWDAWTQAGQITFWWGPKGMQTKVIQHDFKVGGTWKYTMEMPDGNEFITEGAYSEIVELSRPFKNLQYEVAKILPYLFSAYCLFFM